jgi:two-component system sensor histidine kinase MprB
VTALATVAVGLVVAVVAIVAYLTVRTQLQDSLDTSLLQRARAAASVYYVEAEVGGVIPSWVLDAGDVRIATLTSAGTVYVPDSEGRAFPQISEAELAVAIGRASYSIRSATVDDSDYRVAAVPITAGHALVVAQSLAGEDHILDRLGLIMLLVGSGGVIVAAAAGWAAVTGGLRPVTRLTADVERIARTEDLTPLPVAGEDEIARLAQSFNEMLVALAASRDRQRQLVADAGHELRTPLTSMRTNIDLLAQADDHLDAGQRAELLTDVRAQMEELTTLIGDLVELARDEPLRPVVEPLDLTEVLARAVERVRRRAPGLRWELDVSPWYVLGEATALERAVTNLLDNAAKWSPAGGTVHVALHDGTLTVDDEGPGISPVDLPHIFDRFYRSAESRSMPGSGLGLSIVRQTAERHSGTVAAGGSPQGGARLTLLLPGSHHPAPSTRP